MVDVETNRLIIRNFHPDDWQELQQLAIWYRASPWSQYDHPWPTSEEEVKGMVSWFSEGDGYLAACLKATGQLIALIAIDRRMDQEGVVHNLGYVFHGDYHGQGYAAEGCRAAMAHVFETVKADSILTGAHPDNTPSVRLLTRLGLHEVAGGEYAITREDWLALQHT